jgi:hypothetical protein
MTDPVVGWRHVAVVLASNQSPALLARFGIQAPGDAARAWARRFLQDIDYIDETDETDPDRSAAAAGIEADLGSIMTPDQLDALRDGACLVTRPDDGDLDDWWRVFLTLEWQDKQRWPEPRVRLRPDLRETVLAQVNRYAVPELGDDVDASVDTDDPWVAEFAQRHSVSPEDVVRQWAHLRQSRDAVRALYETLSRPDREEFETWAQIHLDALYRRKRRAPRLSLEAAAAISAHVTLRDAD